MSETLYQFLLWFPAILLALTLHEFAHAFCADRLGDPTARSLGRVSLNPLVHLDPVGTILIVLVHFGWGKPVPVDIRYLSNPRRDMVLIAFAGPLANLLTGLVLGLLLRIWGADLLGNEGNGPLLFYVLRATVLLSFLLAFFNLIPLPPLDGSKILEGLLPTPQARLYQRSSSVLSWGLLLLIVLGNFGNFDLLSPLIHTPTTWLYHWLVGPELF